ncbi:archaeosortase/exosortase family protein [Nanoarchaeota archaeon]
MNKGFKQLLIKTGIFLVLFIAISFIIGQKIVESSLLYGFNIFIYGGMGKILLFSIVGFILLYRQKLLNIDFQKYKKNNLIFLLLSALFTILFYILELRIDFIQINTLNTFLIHLIFLSIFFFLLLGVFSLEFLRNFLKKFKKELIYFLLFGIIVYSLMTLVWKLWPFLSLIVLRIVEFMFNLINIQTLLIGERTLQVGEFAAKIGEACSGVYSIFIFASLYLFIVLLDWKKLNKLKAILIFFPAVIGAFFMNVLRVFLLFIVGEFVSRKAALGLYHSYTGMLFFLFYFVIFWLFAYNWIKKSEFKKKKVFMKKIMNDSLYKNSIYMMLSTLVMAVLGFVFWIICARLFTTENVGLATTMISVATLITSFSLLGLNAGLIRYLPKSDDKNKKINTIFTLVTLVTIIVATIFILTLNIFSPRLLFIKESLLLSFSFIFFMIFSSLANLVNSVFVAFRNTKYVLMKNTLFSILKLGLPFLFVSLGAYGLFSSWMISLFISFVFLFFILIYKFNYKPKFVFHDTIIKKIGKFSFGNYIAGFVGALPLMLLPLMITNLINPETTAYYYIAMMIASLLFMIPGSTNQSLFAEGSHSQENLKLQIIKAVKIISVLLIPGIFLTFFFGKYILLAFGKDYSLQGFRFLQIIILSGVFIGANKIFESVFKVRKKIKEILIVNLIGAITILGLSYFWINKGLLWIGIAWSIGQIIMLIGYSALRFFRK